MLDLHKYYLCLYTLVSRALFLTPHDVLYPRNYYSDSLTVNAVHRYSSICLFLRGRPYPAFVCITESFYFRAFKEHRRVYLMMRVFD